VLPLKSSVNSAQPSPTWTSPICDTAGLPGLWRGLVLGLMVSDGELPSPERVTQRQQGEAHCHVHDSHVSLLPQSTHQHLQALLKRQLIRRHRLHRRGQRCRGRVLRSPPVLCLLTLLAQTLTTPCVVELKGSQIWPCEPLDPFNVTDHSPASLPIF
jgi:hypothetical protein